MNVFYLDRDPIQSAKYHCDKHVVKMIVEYAQILSTAHRHLDGDERADKLGLYKSTHNNHPVNVWVRQSHHNYQYVLDMLEQLLKEYTIRYGKTHKTQALLNSLRRYPANLAFKAFTEPSQCVADDCKAQVTVAAYRKYYNIHKKHMAKWKNGNVPHWFVKEK